MHAVEPALCPRYITDVAAVFPVENKHSMLNISLDIVDEKVSFSDRVVTAVSRKVINAELFAGCGRLLIILVAVWVDVVSSLGCFYYYEICRDFTGVQASLPA